MRAGASRVKITPPAGVDLCGFGFREGPSTGVHDDLWCAALVLDDGSTKVAIIALDLLELDYEVDAACREAVSRETGLEPDSVLLNCSHTHSGPSTCILDALGAKDEEYVRRLPGLVAEAVAKAVDGLVPATARYGEAPLGIGVDRRQLAADGSVQFGKNRKGVRDDRMRVVEIRCDGRTGAILFHHACHGTVLGGDNLLISGDWAGAAARAVGEIYPRATPLFLQGCGGQINPDQDAGTFEEVERIGKLAAEAVERALADTREFDAAPLGFDLVRLALPVQDPPDAAAAEADVREAEAELSKAVQNDKHAYTLRTLRTLIERRSERLAWARGERRCEGVPFVVQGLRMGELGIMGLSGEVFYEFGQAIVERSPFPWTLALGYSNGCACYVPTRKAIEQGGYETDQSFCWYGVPPISPEAGAEIVEAAVGLLQNLKRAHGES